VHTERTWRAQLENGGQAKGNPIMKKHCIALIVISTTVLGFTTIAPLARAQDQLPANSQTVRQPPSPEQVVELLGKKLNLTEDQKAKIAPIIAGRQQQTQALRADTSMRQRKKMRKLKSIFKDSDKKIEAILTKEQKQQYAQIKEQMREQMKERKNRGDSD